MSKIEEILDGEPKTGTFVDAEPPVNPVQALMTRMDAHEAEEEAINAELTKLGLNRKKVNSIRSTQKRIAKEQAALANMLG